MIIMMFLTLFFIFLSLVGLFKGKLFYNYGLENAQYEIEKAKGNKVEPPSDLVAKSILLIFFVLFYLISLAIYIVKAIYLDPYIFPTVIYVLFQMVNLLISSSTNKKDLTTEEGRVLYLIQAKKKHSFKGKIVNLIHLSFFVYIFLILVGLVR